MKSFLKYVIELLGGILMWVLKKIIRSIAWFDRKVVKRYLGFETPIYKIWWRNNAECLQNKINNQVK